MKAIEVNNLSFSYHQEEQEDIKVLNNLSFSVNKGETVAFIGPNGSGKSTLMKLLVALLESDEGKIILLDQELNEESVDELRKKIGIVFQNPDNQFIGATVRDDIAFGLENRQVPHEMMEDIVTSFASKVGMEDFLDREPSSLSGGQKQRVAIAGVLSMHPDIIFMDEATAMLDPKGRKEMMELIKWMRINNPSMTIVLVTHHMDEAELCDHIYVLNKGELYLNGTPDEVFSHVDELNAIGLDLPFKRKIINEFNKEGYNVEQNMDMEEVINIICQR